MNKTALGILILVLVVLIGAYFLWDRSDSTAEADPEAAAAGEVINSEESVPETADLEAELNATGADTDEEMRALKAEFEVSN